MGKILEDGTSNWIPALFYSLAIQRRNCPTLFILGNKDYFYITSWLIIFIFRVSYANITNTIFIRFDRINNGLITFHVPHRWRIITFHNKISKENIGARRTLSSIEHYWFIFATNFFPIIDFSFVDFCYLIN